MSKRSRSSKSNGSYTGGTRDIKPQFLTVAGATPTAIDDYAVTSFPLPVPRFGSRQGKATVTEILKVEYFVSPANWADLTGQGWVAFLDPASHRVTGETCTLTAIADDLANPHSLCAVAGRILATNNQGMIQQVVDCTDGNGNGILVAGDKLDLVVGNVSNTAFGPSQCKILYRLVNVGVQEYIGILQGQTAR